MARAEGLQSLVQHKFADKLVADYKEKWEWTEAEKEPEGELMMRKLAEKAGKNETATCGTSANSID